MLIVRAVTVEVNTTPVLLRLDCERLKPDREEWLYRVFGSRMPLVNANLYYAGPDEIILLINRIRQQSGNTQQVCVLEVDYLCDQQLVDLLKKLEGHGTILIREKLERNNYHSDGTIAAIDRHEAVTLNSLGQLVGCPIDTILIRS